MGQSFRDLIVWKRAVEMAVQIYKLTAEFPASERFGLTSQLRRAAVSVSSNIAGGYGRSTKGEYVQFLGHARGSNAEVETQLVIAKALDFRRKEDLLASENLCNEVSKMLVALMKSQTGRSTRSNLVPSS